jgi:hypothetical protein
MKTCKHFIHVPLGEGLFGPSWCLELPDDYATSAPILVLLATEHPELLAHVPYAAHLADVLAAAIAKAQQGDDEALRRCWRILKKRARVDPQTCRAITAPIETSLPKGLRRDLTRHGIAASGRRHDQETLIDFDAVARREAMDRLVDANLDVIDAAGRRTAHRSRQLRVAEVLSERLNISMASPTLDARHPVFRRLFELVGRVRRQAVPLHYVLIGCDRHVAPTSVSETAHVWSEADLFPAIEIERARTITFRPRVAVVPTEINRVANWPADWIAVVRSGQPAGQPPTP